MILLCMFAIFLFVLGERERESAIPSLSGPWTRSPSFQAIMVLKLLVLLELLRVGAYQMSYEAGRSQNADQGGP